ncbi:MAG: NAD(P)-dependent alcohol dehydrogenase [Hyphomicrobiaceae bacterium]
MKAAICTAYGDPSVVQIRDIPAPVAKPNEVLIRIHAATVSSADARIRGARFPSGFALPARLALGLAKPRNPILGTEFSGVIEATGNAVTRFSPGDPVFGFKGARMGCHAELITLAQDGPLAPIPTGFTFEEAAAISFGGTTALYFLRDVARVKPGERVLVNGASGAVGTAAVQLARHFGAHVTGVSSSANANLVLSLGANDVIDYTATDFATSGARWDVILDTVGNVSFARARNALYPNGRLLLIVAGLGELLKAPIQSMTSGLKVSGGPAPDRAHDIADLKTLCDQSAYKPVLDACYPFDQIAKAHARADSCRKTGSVVLTFPASR